MSSTARSPVAHPRGTVCHDDIADLSHTWPRFANNGGGSDGVEYVFPADSASAGTYIYVTANDAVPGFLRLCRHYVNGVVNINGDDAMELFNGATVIDTFGDINTDGNGTPKYLDGWAYRVDGIGPNDGNFLNDDFFYSGPQRSMVNHRTARLDSCSSVRSRPVAAVMTAPRTTSRERLRLHPVRPRCRAR